MTIVINPFIDFVGNMASPNSILRQTHRHQGIRMMLFLHFLANDHPLEPQDIHLLLVEKGHIYSDYLHCLPCLYKHHGNTHNLVWHLPSKLSSVCDHRYSNTIWIW